MKISYTKYFYIPLSVSDFHTILKKKKRRKKKKGKTLLERSHAVRKRNSAEGSWTINVNSTYTFNNVRAARKFQKKVRTGMCYYFCSFCAGFGVCSSERAQYMLNRIKWVNGSLDWRLKNVSIRPRTVFCRFS